MKKIFLTTTIIIAIIATVGGFFVNYKNLNQSEKNSVISTNEKIEENIYHTEYQTSYSLDLKNLDEMYDNHEFIAIIQVDKLNSATTYREKTDEYIKPYTSGEAKVLKVLKGNFESSRISFLRLGGIVSFDDYTKSLYPEAREKIIESLGSESYTYVEEKSKNDIEIENSKTYLVYMNRNDKFHNKNEYTIEAFEYGLREVKLNTNTKSLNINSNEILIKNNKTNEYESIDKAISKEISKQFVDEIKE